MLLTGDVVTAKEFSGQVKPRFTPKNVEVKAERDGVILVINLQNITDLNTCQLRKDMIIQQLNWILGLPDGYTNSQ